MSLLDSVIGAMGGQLGGGGSMAGGGRAALIRMVIGMLMSRVGAGAGAGASAAPAGAAGAGGGALGGLGDLIARFEQGGMGEHVRSWVGNGQNLPVSGDQVQHALGGDLVSQIAQQLGVSQQEASNQLSDVLPEVVDKMTPEGQVPPDGSLGDIGSILGRFA